VETNSQNPKDPQLTTAERRAFLTFRRKLGSWQVLRNLENSMRDDYLELRITSIFPHARPIASNTRREGVEVAIESSNSPSAMEEHPD
jgi:hypothetical protein